MRTVVISQSMYFPWVGLLEQVRLADAFVHYDDVQYTRGSFSNRVQIKTASGVRWMTVPLKGHRLGQLIDEVQIDLSQNWQAKHLKLVADALKQCPFHHDAVELMKATFDESPQTIGELSRASILYLAKYFGLDKGTEFVHSDTLGTAGGGSQRVLELTQKLNGSVYITGHGAKNYMDFGLFEANSIEVRFMDYQCQAYPQQYGDFTPFVTGLDLVANCGREGTTHICSNTTHWKEFTDESA
ncbi:WbqC family protein [Rhodopirellula sp. P2]|uniref:WbqC family protein n=1 Tax=Rhodopirellula sp. P2 TaxID=2127060 RepID=UPI002367CD92|nr:WbqC family protein [Rhodopirellula sp. P2]WDQ17422.1 WbqC family protein [Rhodopirellula sp. P2]